MTPASKRSVAVLQKLIQALPMIALADTAARVSWRLRCKSTMRHILGDDHELSRALNALDWPPLDNGPANAALHFVRAKNRAQGYLEAAVAEVELLDTEGGIFDGAGLDAELWDFVRSDVEAEAWGKAANQAMLFTEDRIRKWAGLPFDRVGVALMGDVFGPKGTFRLGEIEAEKEGWHQLARGMSMALRNAVAHRINDRDDHRRYALGVIGVGSLLLTQLRYEHGESFQDLSAVKPPREAPANPPESAV